MNAPYKTIKWIKIVVDLFDDEKIKLIESLPDRDAILVIWFKILTLAGKSNTGGFLVLSDRIPYSDEMLSTVFNRPINTIRLALRTFEEFGMIEMTEERTVRIPRWSSYQSVDTDERYREQTRKRVTRYREKERQKLGGKVGNVTLENVTQPPAVCRTKSGQTPLQSALHPPDPCNVTDTLPTPGTPDRSHSQECEEKQAVTLPIRYGNAPNIDIERDLEEEKDLKAQSMSSEAREKCDSDPSALSPLAEFWNTTCPNLPAVREMSENRRKKEKLRLEERPDLAEWERIFRMIHESPFCRGNGKTGWRATFDWIIDNPDNVLKVLEGKYGDCKNGRPKDISTMTDAEVVAFLNS